MNEIKPLQQESAEKGLFQNEYIQHVRTINSMSKIVPIPPEIANSQNYSSTSKAVGRIIILTHVIRLKAKGQKDAWQCGTGFCVSNDTVVTAAHVFHNPDSKYINIYMFFGYNAHIPSEIDMDDIDNCDGVYELISLGREFHDQFKDPLLVRGVDNSNQQFKWYFDNDLQFLKFKNKPNDHTYLIPKLPDIEGLKDHFVMGYPGLPDMDTFVKRFSLSLKQDELSYIDACFKAYAGFQKKTVCIGTIHPCRSNVQVLSHCCPTFTGTSGGILANSQYNQQFIGIHIGNATETGSIAISVTHPLFAYLYSKYVLIDEDFIIKNHVLLAPYIEFLLKQLQQPQQLEQLQKQMQQQLQQIHNLYEQLQLEQLQQHLDQTTLLNSELGSI
ncbi:hypothetical protein PPL_06839 [Heterostelium album PN500]|uniref:Serine protease n=1 Tax=Heterostelium pallidum (strain ATCC 26659 / Pp 5 / PN500) TaxID=670386 RepID=D3BDN7_HETP5|nr:hypothetical protein PPL_06839 [Heterostelium album PN500]EFA80018.1 hypothetical protein PPL_06839 [Heterostelium album PN500]|eukprot:XP_020432138.1 hypothetical protein PPL_06839 [Heterostelium album PN500]